METSAPARVLEAAVRLFAERGFDEVSVREIAEAAAANVAAINYYFGGKEQLIRQVIRSVIAPLNQRRLAALAQAQRELGEPDVIDVVKAMVEPTVEACKSGTGPERHYARILVLAFALRQPFVDEVMSEQTDSIALSFVEALGRSLPGIDRAEIYWRYDFMIGSLLHILLDSSRDHRLKRLSGGLCDTSSVEAITEQLVVFLTAGMGASRPAVADG